MKRLASILTVLAIIFLLSQVYAQNSSLSNLRSIARSDSGLYTAVGDAGLIITSTDGVNWSKVISYTSENLNGVIWAMEKFVAVGDKGTVLTSSDGKDWSKANISGKEVDLYSVAGSDKEIIAAGDEGIVFVSKDGVLWEQRRMATKEIIYRIRRINDRYFAVGYPKLILTSEDGITWEEAKAELSSNIAFTDIAWNGDKYAVVGDRLNIWLSKDGKVWSQDEAILDKEGMDSTRNIYSVVYSGEKFVTVGDGGDVLSSTDGSDWKREDSDTSRNLKDIIYSKGQFTAVGEKGIIITSDDGSKWTNHDIISVSAESKNLKPGQKNQLSILLYAPYGDSEDVTGEALFEVVEGKDVVSVGENGEIKALGVGRASVKATYDSKWVELSISVEEDTSAKSGLNEQNNKGNSREDKNSSKQLNILIAAGAIVAVIALSLILMKLKKD